jgi:hypothetical protein
MVRQVAPTLLEGFEGCGGEDFLNAVAIGPRVNPAVNLVEHSESAAQGFPRRRRLLGRCMCSMYSARSALIERQEMWAGSRGRIAMRRVRQTLHPWVGVCGSPLCSNISLRGQERCGGNSNPWLQFAFQDFFRA